MYNGDPTYGWDDMKKQVKSCLHVQWDKTVTMEVGSHVNREEC